MPSRGTRPNPTPQPTYTSASITRFYTQDVGMTKLATASLTFGAGRVVGANGTFGAFAVYDVVRIEGCNINNGTFAVTGVDAANASYLALRPSPKTEGPIVATVRTA